MTEEREAILKDRIGEMWWPYLGPEFDKDYLINIGNTVDKLRNIDKKQIFPAPENVFKAFKMTPPQLLKVVIVGQDPYHDGVNATGLAFECGGRKSGKLRDVTPSWDKVLKGYDKQFPSAFSTDLYDGDCERWAHSGVLLLNAALTVEKSVPNSHEDLWAPFTKTVIELIARSQRPKFFIFFGRKAQRFQKYVKTPHSSIYREHPAAASYENRDWEHGNCFLEANEFLKQTKQDPIDW